MGLLLAVVVHAANIQDRDGAKLVLAKLLGRFPRLRVIWADAGYAGRLVAWAWNTGGWLLTVVRRKPDTHHFEVLPRRWVVERTLAWLSRCRWLSKCPASTIFAGWRQSVLPVHLLGLAPLLGSVGPVAGDVKLQDDGVVHDPVNRRGGGHGVGKDALPL